MAISTIKFSEFAAVNLATTTNKIVGVSSLYGGSNFYSDFPQSWITGNRPTAPAPGTLGYNSSLGQYEYWNGASWVQLASGGSGSVNLGSINQVAWYAATGTAISGLGTLANGVLVTSSGSVPSISATLPASLSIPQPIIGGVINGSNAASGVVGEYISATVLSGASVSAINGTPTNVSSVNLTAGDWDLWGNIAYAFSAASGTYISGWISATSATGPDTALAAQMQLANAQGACGMVVPYVRISISSPQTVYLTGQGNFLSGTCTLCGTIHARRVR